MNAASVFINGRARSLSQRTRYRWSVASRTLAAIVGGYAVTSLFNIVLPLLLGAVGMSVPRALLATTMGSFLLYVAIIMAVFNARSAMLAWVWLISAAVPLGVVVFLLLPGAHL